MIKNFNTKTLFLSLVAGLGFVANATALPFNNDMEHTAIYRPGSIAKNRPENSVPVGSLSYRLTKKDDALNLPNPMSGDALSASRGKQLYMMHCSSCHGAYSGGKYAVGAAGARMILPPPDVTNDYYKSRTDGFFYGTITLGGAAMMPALGFKLSTNERWDIVSFIRELQRGGAR